MIWVVIPFSREINPFYTKPLKGIYTRMTKFISHKIKIPFTSQGFRKKSKQM